MGRPTTQYFTFDGMIVTLYAFANVGDEIAMHAHNFAHLSIPISGRFIGYDGEGREIDIVAGGNPALFGPDKKHAIRAFDAGAVLMSIQPDATNQLTTVFSPVERTVKPNTASFAKAPLKF